MEKNKTIKNYQEYDVTDSGRSLKVEPGVVDCIRAGRQLSSDGRPGSSFSLARIDVFCPRLVVAYRDTVALPLVSNCVALLTNLTSLMTGFVVDGATSVFDAVVSFSVELVHNIIVSGSASGFLGLATCRL